MAAGRLVMGMPIIAHSSQRQPSKCHRNTANQVLALAGVNISDMMDPSKLTPHFLANFLPGHLFQEDVNLPFLLRLIQVAAVSAGWCMVQSPSQPSIPIKVNSSGNRLM